MQEHLDKIGIAPSTYSPPLLRLLWKCGVEIPPPLFMTFGSAALFTGSLFGVFWGLFMWLFAWSHQGMSVGLALAAAILAGVLFGVCMAAYMQHVRRKNHLPVWADYAGAE